MDIFGEMIANIRVKTDAKNLVTTAITIHLPGQKETIHMISMLRKEACSGSIQDLAHIPTQHCLGRLPHKGFSQGGQQSDDHCADKKIA